MTSSISVWEPLEAPLWDLVSGVSPVLAAPPRTLKVLQIVNGEHYAGAERVQDLLAESLLDFGVHTTFACVKPNRFPATRRCQQTPLVKLPMRSRFDLRPAVQMARMIRQEHFDLIHTHTPRAALVGQLAARLANVPMVHHVHGHTAVEVGRGWRAWLSARSEKFSLSKAAAVVAVSPTAAGYINAWGVPSERIHLVPNGVPSRKFVNRSLPTTWTLGVVALFRPRKGLEVLLESMAEMRRRNLPVRLRVIGGFETPEYEKEVRQLVGKLGIEQLVEWRGFCTNVDAEFDQLDLMVMPSTLPEGMPMVLLEALAAGVPPLGSRVAGITDVIQHGRNGLLFEPNDSGALADAVSSVIAGAHDWNQLRRCARASHAENFSDRRMAREVADIYRTVLENHEHA